MLTLLMIGAVALLIMLIGFIITILFSIAPILALIVCLPVIDFLVLKYILKRKKR